MNEQLSDQNQLARETKQERRERRRAKEKTKMVQHGKSLASVYKDAGSKRAKAEKARKQSSYSRVVMAKKLPRRIGNRHHAPSHPVVRGTSPTYCTMPPPQTATTMSWPDAGVSARVLGHHCFGLLVCYGWQRQVRRTWRWRNARGSYRATRNRQVPHRQAGA